MASATIWLSNIRNVRKWRLEWRRSDWRTLGGGVQGYAAPEWGPVTSQFGFASRQVTWESPDHPLVVDDHGVQPVNITLDTETGVIAHGFDSDFDTGPDYTILDVRFRDGDELTIPLNWSAARDYVYATDLEHDSGIPAEKAVQPGRPKAGGGAGLLVAGVAALAVVGFLAVRKRRG